ncbi:g9769 [Coccomyxa viridis]|uniref:G9769 protein n=1 Tax=Coccomyxa viridis TaxID=1274662 RepID=A0ABP1G3L6_9CHLO
MAEGDNEDTRRTNEELRLALDAANKRNSDLLINQQMGETVLTEVASLKHMFQAHQPGLSEEAKKARIAPGKPSLNFSYALLKYPQIADMHGYPVAEAWFKVNNGTDDASLKHLELAIKMAEKEGHDAYGYYQPQGYGPPQMPAAPGGYFVAAPGPGPAQVVKALGAPGTLAGHDDVPETFVMDCIDSDASEAGPSCAPADADTAAAAAEPPRYIKGRLKAKLAFWKLFCTSTWVLSWISDGYQIPWNEWGPPPSHAYANQQGALRHQEFVSKEVADLLARGSIIQTDKPPLVVNPLNVVEHNGKLRLILDLVYVNYYIRKEV